MGSSARSVTPKDSRLVYAVSSRRKYETCQMSNAADLDATAERRFRVFRVNSLRSVQHVAHLLPPLCKSLAHNANVSGYSQD